jgi:hypothetical protein
MYIGRREKTNFRFCSFAHQHVTLHKDKYSSNRKRQHELSCKNNFLKNSVSCKKSAGFMCKTTKFVQFRDDLS